MSNNSTKDFADSTQNAHANKVIDEIAEGEYHGTRLKFPNQDLFGQRRFHDNKEKNLEEVVSAVFARRKILVTRLWRNGIASARQKW